MDFPPVVFSLAASDTPIMRAAIAEPLSDNQAVTQNMGTGGISGIAVKTLTIQISAGGNASIQTELSDFGSFSMMTKMQSLLGFSSTSFEIKHVVLR